MKTRRTEIFGGISSIQNFKELEIGKATRAVVGGQNGNDDFYPFNPDHPPPSGSNG